MRWAVIVAVFLTACETTEQQACDLPPGIFVDDPVQMTDQQLYDEYQAISCLQGKR